MLLELLDICINIATRLKEVGGEEARKVIIIFVPTKIKTRILTPDQSDGLNIPYSHKPRYKNVGNQGEAKAYGSLYAESTHPV